MKRMNPTIVGAIVGVLGGISFGIAVLPFALGHFLPQAATAVTGSIFRYVLPASLLWLPSGALAGRAGSIWQGARYMAVGGLAAGIVFGWLVGGGPLQTNIMMVSGVAGALYGAGAGLLIGGAFPR